MASTVEIWRPTEDTIPSLYTSGLLCIEEITCLAVINLTGLLITIQFSLMCYLYSGYKFYLCELIFNEQTRDDSDEKYCRSVMRTTLRGISG